MAQAPDRIEADIETTRAALVRDVDALADRTLPNRVVGRRWADMKQKVHSMSEKVMGTPGAVGDKTSQAGDKISGMASDAGDKIGDMAGSVAHGVQQAPEMVARQTRGNPLAAGMIAFGVGLLTASLLPTPQIMQRTGERIRDNAADVLEPLAEPAQRLKDDLSTSVGEAVDQVKETAGDAVHKTADETKSAAQEAKDRTQQAM
jgi:ElaB/YqjD/DUF883 family membrane-anchored ribosome-binding protein